MFWRLLGVKDGVSVKWRVFRMNGIYILRQGHVVDLRIEARAIRSSVHPQVRFAGIAADIDCETVSVVRLHSSRPYLLYYSSVLFSFPDKLTHTSVHAMS